MFAYRYGGTYNNSEHRPDFIATKHISGPSLFSQQGDPGPGFLTYNSYGVNNADNYNWSAPAHAFSAQAIHPQEQNGDTNCNFRSNKNLYFQHGTNMSVTGSIDPYNRQSHFQYRELSQKQDSSQFQVTNLI